MTTDDLEGCTHTNGWLLKTDHFVCLRCGKYMKTVCKAKNKRGEQCWLPKRHEEEKHMTLTKGNI